MNGPLDPPSAPRWLLERVLPRDAGGDSIRGDLLEEMTSRAALTTVRRARWWYWRQAITVAIYAVRSQRRVPRGASPRKASIMDALRFDLKLAIRSLRNARGFTSIAVLTLALGLGATTAVFAVVNAILLRPLPFAHPDRVMWLTETHLNGAGMSIAWPDYLDWRDHLRSFDELAAIRRGVMNFTGAGDPERLLSRHVTANFFHVLGVQPALGRVFSSDEDRAGGARVALISDTFWRRRFDADASALGRTMTLDGEPFEVIGVLPRGFIYNQTEEDDVFTPLGQQATSGTGLLDRGNHNGLSAIGRLRTGVDEAAAQRDLDDIAASLTRAYPRSNSDVRGQLEPLAHRLIGPSAPTIKALFGAVVFLLLLATVNVSNLLVARSVSRRRELSIRAALGCGRGRLVRQSVVESGLLTMAGGLFGVLIAYGLTSLFLDAAPADLPRVHDVGISWPVLAFAFVTSAVAALLLAIFPAIQSTGIRGQMALVRAGRDDGSSAPGRRIRRTLMVVEVALAIVLLTGAGLMMRTIGALSSVDLGFDSANVLTARFNLTGDRSTPELREAFNRQVSVFGDRVLTRVKAVPGVGSAALTLSLPIEGSQWGSIFIVAGQPVPPRASLPTAAFIPVSTGYFETMRIPLLSGRGFDSTDTAASMKTAIVNETFARHFWPNDTAIGKRLKQSWPEDQTPWREIVGVVHDVKLQGVEADTPMQVYLPFAQEPLSYVALVARTTAPPSTVVKPLASAIHELNPSLPLFAVQTVDEMTRASIAQHRMTMVIFGGFAIIALVLASVGLYGVVSHGVSERTREVGVRMALGATPRQVLRLFVGQGVVTTAAGIVLGVGSALWLARLVSELLFNVSPTDPVTFAAVVTTLLVVSIAACYIPARRAADTDPLESLREG